MPEGPSIVILKEEAQLFIGKKVLQVSGNAKVHLHRLQSQKITDLKTWGKQFLICFEKFTVRVHLLLFGSYRINERREMPPRLSLQFKNGEMNFYNCSVKILDEELDSVYDWEVDLMSDEWNPVKAFNSIRMQGDTPVCDILLDQDIFAGSGNIVKNEVLFITRIHPLTAANALTAKKLRALVTETRNYCFRFYEWKRKFEFKKHWQVYRSKICPRCDIPLIIKPLGRNMRRTFFCSNCQILYKKKIPIGN